MRRLVKGSVKNLKSCPISSVVWNYRNRPCTQSRSQRRTVNRKKKNLRSRGSKKNKLGLASRGNNYAGEVNRFAGLFLLLRSVSEAGAAAMGSAIQVAL